MKAEPYKFWCTPCKIRHAGECPPRSNPCAEICLTCPAGFCQCVNVRRPVVGKKYVVECQQPDRTWKTRNPPARWLVTSVDLTADKVEMRDVDYGNYGQAKLAAFTDDGWSSAVFGYQWRMVPAP